MSTGRGPSVAVVPRFERRALAIAASMEDPRVGCVLVCFGLCCAVSVWLVAVVGGCGLAGDVDWLWMWFVYSLQANLPTE